MARKYINLFDEQGNPVRVPLGADAENVDIEPINGMEAENVQEAIEELAGQQVTIEMDDVPTPGSTKAVKSGGVYTALGSKQDKLTAGQNISISQQGVISATGGGSDAAGMNGECVDLNVGLTQGYKINNESGALVQSSGYYVTDEISSTGRVGKFLFMPEGKVEGDISATFRRYHKENGNIVVDDSVPVERYGNNPNVIIPIMGSDEFYQIAVNSSIGTSAKVYLVTKRWLKCHGLCTDWAGKKWLMYGDSYVGGYTLGNPKDTWHSLFSYAHCAKYTNKGYNGIGLVRAPNVTDNLITLLDTWLLDGNGDPLDVDCLGVTIGRNDYSAGVSIGTIDDEIDITVQNWKESATFMGALNYLCKWLIDNYTCKLLEDEVNYKGTRIFFITPWYFLDNMPNAVAEPVDYVDAVKAVAGKWGIPCFDAARQSGINVQNDAFRTAFFNELADTSHLNKAGHRRMALGPVCKWLENLFSE